MTPLIGNARAIAGFILVAAGSVGCGGEAGADSVRLLDSVALVRTAARTTPFWLEDVSPTGREFLVRLPSPGEITCPKLVLVSVDGNSRVLAEDVTPLEGVYGRHAVFSPQGDRVAYLSSTTCQIAERIEERRADLAIVTTDGQSSANLAGNFLGVSAWTSDDRIIVRGEEEDVSSVWAVRPDLSGFNDLGPRNLLEVSTDGRTSVYNSGRSGLVFERDGEEAIQVAGGWINPEGLLSADGRFYPYVPFGTEFDGWRMFDIERKTETAVRLPDKTASITSAEWSPDGRILIIEAERAPSFDEVNADRHQAYVLNSDGSDFRLLTSTGFGHDMAWRPPLLFYRRENSIAVSVISRGAIDERAASELLSLIRESFPEPISLKFASEQ